MGSAAPTASTAGASRTRYKASHNHTLAPCILLKHDAQRPLKCGHHQLAGMRQHLHGEREWRSARCDAGGAPHFRAVDREQASARRGRARRRPHCYLAEHKGARLALAHGADIDAQPLPLCPLLHWPRRIADSPEGQLAAPVPLGRCALWGLKHSACWGKGSRITWVAVARCHKPEVGTR